MAASPSHPKITAALASMRMLLNAGLPIQKVFRNCGDVAGSPWRFYFERAAQRADEGEPFEQCLDELREVLPFAERVMLTLLSASADLQNTYDISLVLLDDEPLPVDRLARLRGCGRGTIPERPADGADCGLLSLKVALYPLPG